MVLTLAFANFVINGRHGLLAQPQTQPSPQSQPTPQREIEPEVPDAVRFNSPNSEKATAYFNERIDLYSSAESPPKSEAGTSVNTDRLPRNKFCSFASCLAKGQLHAFRE
jgi:hypothetical protein